MSHLDEQVVETWHINNRVNLMLLDAIPDEALDFTLSKRGGGKIGYQLAHLYNVRFWHLESKDKSLIAGWSTLKKEDPVTRAILADKLNSSAAAIEQLLQKSLDNDGAIKGNKRGVIPFLGYLIAHEAHHRGNILLTLKQCGFKIPDALKYGIWDWPRL